MAPHQRGISTQWLRSKSVRERQIPHDFTHMWNLRNKTNEKKKKRKQISKGKKKNERHKPRNRLLTLENKLMVTRGEVLVWSASFLTAAEVANRPPKLPAHHCLAWKVTAPSRTTSRAPSCCWATATAVFLQNTAWHLEHGAAKHQCTREHECKDSSDTCYVRDSAESMNSMTAASGVCM
ncbi:uncharacterized protein LOC144301830 isoform X7 [Canis aureus]